MTKKEFIEKYFEKAGISRAKATENVEVFLDILEESLIEQGNVQFIGFGNFEVKGTPERQGRNPKTGEAITIAAKKVLKFKAGGKISKKINE